MERGEPILQVRNLVKHFPLTQGIVIKRQVGAVKAVDGISFDLYQGETLGIVGESGCGKSTVAKLLMSLERADRPARSSTRARTSPSCPGEALQGRPPRTSRWSSRTRTPR